MMHSGKMCTTTEQISEIPPWNLKIFTAMTPVSIEISHAQTKMMMDHRLLKMYDF